MGTLQYSELYKACEGPITRSTVLNYSDLVNNINVAADLTENEQLPSCFRPYVIAIRDISEAESEAYLASWKRKLQSPVLNLADSTISYLYMLVYILLFISLYAINDYSDLFNRLYEQLISLFTII